MLLNFTNHPSDRWTPEQKDLAQQQYGGVVDLKFPNINPKFELEDIKKLALDYLAQITEIPNITAVHLMGEFTFVYTLVNMLKTLDIPVVASTTERTVIEEANGKKTVKFRFIKFRNFY